MSGRQILTDAERRELADKLRNVRGINLLRIVGSLAGAMVSKSFASGFDLYSDDPLEREFLAGFTEGRLARNLGDLIGMTRKTKTHE